MEDEKKIKEGTKEDIVLEKRSGEKEFSGAELNDELERLAQTFRNELKKAQELSDEEFVEAYADDLGIIPAEELCECCGERRRDKSRGESYQYCSVCRENMKIYPLSIPNILVAVAIVVLAFMSTMNFCTDFNGYDYMYKALKAEDDNKLTSAIKYYDEVIDIFSAEEVTPKKAYLNSAQLIFKTMDDGTNSMYEVSHRIDIALSEIEKKLPIYNSVIETQNKSMLLYGTMQEFYNIISDEKYADYTKENTEMYKSIMADIVALSEKEISVVSTDGKTTQLKQPDEAMVKFCQYMFAYVSGNYDESYSYMLETQELAPAYLWLYAYELGIVEAQTGDVSKAKELAKSMIDLNVEDSDGYTLYSTVERICGNFEKSARWASKGLEYTPENAELMRLKAMALCCSGDYEQAKTIIDKALEKQQYAMLYFTAIVVENELGNKGAVDEFKEALKTEGVEMSDRMNEYLSGKITALQLFTEGTGEVE